jgi:hypothetical protein
VFFWRSQDGERELAAQLIRQVDRNPFIQAAFVLLLNETGGWHWEWATAVSTGQPAGFEHFITPLA